MTLYADDQSATARPNAQAKRRDEILNAAEKLLLRPDTAAVLLADVAAELDMTPNAVRYYYRDVEGLISELSQRGNERASTPSGSRPSKTSKTQGYG